MPNFDRIVCFGDRPPMNRLRHTLNILAPNNAVAGTEDYNLAANNKKVGT